MPAPTDVDGHILATGEFTSLRALWGSFQLTAPDERPLFTAKKVNSITYAEDLNKNVTSDRHPYLRVIWKPDVETLESSIGSSLPAKEKSVLSVWARNLAVAARNAKGQVPQAAGLIEAISALNISTEAYDVELATFNLNLSGSKLHPSFYRLEAIYVAMMLALSGQQTVAPSGSDDSLVKTPDLAEHKHPGMNILQVVNSEADLTRKLPAVLEGDSSLSSLQRYLSFTYLAASDELVEASAEVYPDGRDV